MVTSQLKNNMPVNMIMRKLLVRDLEVIRHRMAMSIMKEIERKKIDFCIKKETIEPPDTLIICEHHPVYTVGIRTSRYTSTEELDKLIETGADVEFTNRGGLITFHGPGQLVCYPVINLRRFQKSVRWYIRQMEEVIIKTCNHYGIKGGRTKDVGVWVEDRKIAALGVHASNYITSHGLSLNCNNDLSWFSHIDPCGIPDKEVTSITNEIKKGTPVSNVMPIFLNKFSEVFECELIH